MSKSAKTSVNITELRRNLSAHLSELKKGNQIEVTARGKLIVSIVAGGDSHREARERLLTIRKRSKVGDIVGPTDAKWNAER